MLEICGRCLCAQVSFHAGWTIHGGMPNVGDSTREALAISWVPEQTTMLPAFDVVGKYSSDDKLTINKLLKLKPGMAVTDDILPVRAADSLGLLVSLSGLRCADGVAASRGHQARLVTRLS